MASEGQRQGNVDEVRFFTTKKHMLRGKYVIPQSSHAALPTLAMSVCGGRRRLP